MLPRYRTSPAAAAAGGRSMLLVQQHDQPGGAPFCISMSKVIPKVVSVADVNDQGMLKRCSTVA